ncbi:uncharacterized protein LOC113272763 [Papaver somniferum]|uniref:uncharacterized protein LOC113272763 n=1 Tax=Papaver somniferum TaxID=3469 RepID=UPI000E6FC73F|nr:uncharacterized protein LOC113272763 [Papaver somniferum]
MDLVVLVLMDSLMGTQGSGNDGKISFIANELQPTPRMIIVLKELTYGDLVTPSESSEELREGIVRCFRALLLRLHSSSNVFSICTQISSIFQTLLLNKSEPDECLVAFLQSQDASAAVGYWLLRHLKVGTDALAFFSPGVVSRFAKVLHMSKAMISGAGASTEAIDPTIRGLIEFFMIDLKDDAYLPGLGVPENDIFQSSSTKRR